MAKTIKIRSVRPDNTVVLWERNAKHPGGEVFVAGPTVVEAGLTGLVSQRIHEGQIEVVGNEEPVPSADDDEEIGAAGGESGEPPPITPAVTDDLTAISGISQARQAILQNMGIFTFHNLADAPAADIAAAISGIGLATVERWQSDARNRGG